MIKTDGSDYKKMDHPALVWVNFMDLSHLDERSQHFQLEILHVSDPIGAALNDTDFVVESFHKTEGHFMIRTAVTDDALPMALHQSDKFLVRLQTTPFELSLPVLKELERPRGIPVIPKLSEGFFKHIGFAQALIGLEQQGQGATAIQIEIGFMRQKRIALSFDETFIFGGDSGIFPPPHFVERLRQLLQDMEFIKDDFSIGRVVFQRVPERLPHVHHRQAQGTVSLRPHIVEEPVHVLFGAAQLLAHPNRTLLIQVGDHDGVTLTLADRDFIYADRPQTLPGQMLGPEIPHIADIHSPDLIPTEMMELGNLLDGHRPAQPTDGFFESLGEAARFGQPCQRFLLHPIALPAIHPPILEFQLNPGASGINIAHPVDLMVVETAGGLAA